jgi:hypothetical protein
LFNTKLGGQSALALPSSSSSSHSRLDWQAEFFKKKLQKTQRRENKTNPTDFLYSKDVAHQKLGQPISNVLFYFILFFFCETRDFAQK